MQKRDREAGNHVELEQREASHREALKANNDHLEKAVEAAQAAQDEHNHRIQAWSAREQDLHEVDRLLAYILLETHQEAEAAA